LNWNIVSFVVMVSAGGWRSLSWAENSPTASVELARQALNLHASTNHLETLRVSSSKYFLNGDLLNQRDGVEYGSGEVS